MRWLIPLLVLVSGCAAVQLPESASLNWQALTVHSQGQTPTCAGHSAAQAVRLAYIESGADTGDLDGQVAYERIRSYTGHLNPITSAKTAAEFGLDLAGQSRVHWQRVDDVDGLKSAIATGEPVIVSRTLPNGVGHQELAVEYAGDEVRLLNSWGVDFGDRGTHWVSASELCHADGDIECAAVWRE